MKYTLDTKTVKEKTVCYHCGEPNLEVIAFDDKEFCCDGCKVVYELLKDNNLCTYYSLNNTPGNTKKSAYAGKFNYLDNDEIKSALVGFTDDKQSRITFYIPKMHCSSCIWLLENLHKLNPEIINSTVNFLKKEATITYNFQNIKLSALVEILADIGYEPLINLNDLENKKVAPSNKSRLIKIGIAGFCFGNIMMLSFPEYFTVGKDYDQHDLKVFFGILNVILSLPSFFYSASEFFVSAYKSIKNRYLNIDAPIAISLLVIFIRSIYEIATSTGSGYLDSLTGIVFFMLVGRLFQDKTYETLSFERDYKSYFPLAVTLIKDNKESSVSVSKLKRGDRIIIRNSEIIPVDSILVNESTHIDYSFVTGESKPVKKFKGELIYAGGKQLDGAIQLDTEKEVSQSYLTALWNNDHQSHKQNEESQEFILRINKYFVFTLLAIAVGAFLFWAAMGDSGRGMNALTAVLIIACPCALLLSATFTNGNMLRIFGRNKFYIKNASVIERLNDIDAIVFDKTGTITHGSSVSFVGNELSDEEYRLAISLASNSSHPLSRKICEKNIDDSKLPVTDFTEIKGQGISGLIDNKRVKMGSEYFVSGKKTDTVHASSKVYFSLNDNVFGFFSIDSFYRDGILPIANELKKEYTIKLLSGDNNSEKETLKQIFDSETDMYFNQQPEEKLEFIKSLQDKGHKVIMLGDGLNDAGALMQSNVGIAVSDDTNNFSPSCDAILDGSAFSKLKLFIDFAKSGRKVIIASFIVSLIYNVIGLSFAVQGTLSPIIAAILMPVSSISIVLLTTLSSSLIAKRKGL